QLIREMIDYVRENEIDELKDLIDYAIENRYEDWFPLLCDNSTFIMNNYIKSVRHRVKNNKRI
ncbi:replication protein, partial [Staphylococcus aureus]